MVHSEHQFVPEDFLVFCELSGFIQDWESLGLDVEIDLLALQVTIMTRPKRGIVIQGTGGLRKLEFSPPAGIGGKRKGKRKACRVCYVHFEEFHTVLLVTAYAKGRKDDLTADEKAAAKKAIERAYQSLARRYAR